jgi:hypothetical protein
LKDKQLFPDIQAWPDKKDWISGKFTENLPKNYTRP